MAASDINIKDSVAGIILPILVLMLIMYYFKDYIKQLSSRFTAWVLNYGGKLSNKYLRRHKQELFDSLQKLKRAVGDDLYILEIGAGGGANFQFYPPGSRVTCLDPNPFFKQYNEKNAIENSQVKLRGFVKGYAEDMNEIEDCSYDVVVSTLVMCSVRDPKLAIGEIRRILKYNGKYYFMDHVAASSYGIIYLLQKLINPVWRRLTGGCEVTRSTGEMIKQHGKFKSLDMQYFSFPSWLAPPVIRPCCMGIATK